MRLSRIKIQTLRAVKDAAEEGLLWMPDQQQWITPGGEILPKRILWALVLDCHIRVSRIDSEDPIDWRKHQARGTITPTGIAALRELHKSPIFQ